MSTAEPSIALDIQPKDIAAGGVGRTLRPLKAGPLGGYGGGQVGRWMKSFIQVAEVLMWIDPSKLTPAEIEAAIAKITAEIREALGSGDRIGELSSKLWRLRAEAQFRQRRM